MVNHPNRSKAQSAEDWIANLRSERERTYATEYLAWYRSSMNPSNAPNRGPIKWERAFAIRAAVTQRA
jgi:hypothetical protein